MREVQVEVGDKFGRWTVIDNTARTASGRNRASICRCECGTVRLISNADLKNGHSKSCGCGRLTSNGKCRTRLYAIYCHVKDRCYNKNHIHYKDYGGRGIGVCQEWRDSFCAFYDWAMANGYIDDLSIDRIDNNKGYSPENCRWTDAEIQQNNTRYNVRLTYGGKTQSMSRWSRELGIPTSTLFSRYYSGWETEEILTRPVDRSKASKKKEEV